ncbi:MAG: hypothetical protein K1W30_20705 [Lachnospiraceae bacterium]
MNMETDGRELNEMELLERNIIKSYNELLKTLLEEGDMDTLERVITDDEYRYKLMDMHTNRLKIEHEL